MVGRSLWVLPPDPARQRALGARFASSGESSKSVVRVLGWLESGRAYRGWPLRLRLIVENHSAGKVTKLRLIQLETPGFETVQRTGPPPELKPGESALMEAVLKPAEHGRFSITALVGWESAAAPGSVATEEPITLGPVEITSPGRERWALFTGRSYPVLKDITLPILLAVLAYLFQKSQGRREKQDQRRQEARERGLQVWSSQLPRLHENNERYYMPVARAVTLLRKEWEKGETSRDAVLAMYALYYHVEANFEVAVRARALKEFDLKDDLNVFKLKLQGLPRFEGRPEQVRVVDQANTGDGYDSAADLEVEPAENDIPSEPREYIDRLRRDLAEYRTRTLSYIGRTNKRLAEQEKARATNDIRPVASPVNASVSTSAAVTFLCPARFYY
jgi:hypothetical protein